MEYSLEIKQLEETVIKGDYCIGCGACAAISGSPFKIKMNEYGNYIAYLGNEKDTDTQVKLLDICPFSGESKNEDELGEIFFPENKRDKHIGNYLKCFAGYVIEGDYRAKGSSGGFGKWLGCKLLKEKRIDYFIQVVSNSTMNSDVPLFDYGIFTDPNEVIKGSKSSYYPTTLNKVIKRIEEVDGRYAITGTPCFIKMLRLLSLRSTILRDRILFTIGIVCGGMKSANHAKMIGWQLGVHPNDLVAIDFRRKYTDRPTGNKIYQVWSNKDNKERYENANLLCGTDYGTGFFKPNACDYCDDVVAETADISFGDAWLPQYGNDPKGTSIIIVRNKILSQIMRDYRIKNEIYLEEIDKEEVVKSQAAGFRHRREALSFRIAKKKNENIWFPKKRVKANEFIISNRRQKIYSLREIIAKESHITFVKALYNDDLKYFLTNMKRWEKKYFVANYGSLFTRGIKKIRKIFLFIKKTIMKK